MGELTEVDRLRRWKAEAMVVLAEWEQVYDELGRPGELGGSKAIAALVEVRQLATLRASLLGGA